jgi:hypothetical protein
MSAQQIAAALGEASQSGEWWRCRCPAESHKSAALAVRDGPRGLIAHCHAGCSTEVVLEQIQKIETELEHDGILSAPPPQRSRATIEARRKFRRDTARDIWATSWPWHTGTIIETYLASRLILIDPPSSIRLQGALGPYGMHSAARGCRPQMVAAVQDVNRRLVAVSRTFLAIDGSCKASVDPQRLFVGTTKGAACRLALWRPGDWLLVSEGVETGLSLLQATQHPTWAALSAEGIRFLQLPREIDRVLVGADNDQNGVGIRLAEEAVKRFRQEGRKAEIFPPPEVGKDWNDRHLTADFWASRPPTSAMVAA